MTRNDKNFKNHYVIPSVSFSGHSYHENRHRSLFLPGFLNEMTEETHSQLTRDMNESIFCGNRQLVFGGRGIIYYCSITLPVLTEKD